MVGARVRVGFGVRVRVRVSRVRELIGGVGLPLRFGLAVGLG